VRDPHAITEKREAAIAEATKLLRPLVPARSWAIVSWNDPDASDPRDVYEAAVGFVIALLEQQAADELLGVHAPIVRKIVLPKLRELGRPPRGKGRRRGSNLFRDRLIAAVVAFICQQFELDPYRNPLSEHRCNGCAVVTEALDRLGIPLAEKTVETIYGKHGQA
jgi:hypothetical protein